MLCLVLSESGGDRKGVCMVVVDVFHKSGRIFYDSCSAKGRSLNSKVHFFVQGAKNNKNDYPFFSYHNHILHILPSGHATHLLTPTSPLHNLIYKSSKSLTQSIRSVVLLYIKHIVPSNQQLPPLLHHLLPLELLRACQQDVHGTVQAAQGARVAGVVVVEFDLDGAAEELLDEIGWAVAGCSDFTHLIIVIDTN